MKTEIFFLKTDGHYEGGIHLREGIYNPETNTNLYILTEGDVDEFIKLLTNERRRVYNASEDTEGRRQNQDNE